MTVTIKDVAKEAGVSPSTVSRVISGNPRISEETKRRVRKVMEELGYHPNMNARSLVVKSTETIGLIMPRSAENTFINPFFPEVLRGIGAAAQERGYSLLISTGRNDEEKIETVVKMVQGKQVDGVILLNSRMKDPILSYLKKQRFPFVMIGRPLEKNITYVDNDNIASAKEATHYLIEMGHRAIAFVGGNPDHTVTRDRLEGYKEALKEAGLPFSPSQVLHADFLEEGAYEAVRALLSIGQRPTAFMVTDDLMALGVISALKEMGFSVPEDVSIVSFNNVFLSRLSSPPLTTVDIGIFQLGFQAVQKLFERIHYPEIASGHTIISTKLIIRQSVRRLEDR